MLVARIHPFAVFYVLNFATMFFIQSNVSFLVVFHCSRPREHLKYKKNTERMPTNILLKSHVKHSKQYRSPCRVLLGLHGNSTEGFFLKNLCCLECMAVCRLYIGPIYTPIKILNPPLSIYIFLL